MYTGEDPEVIPNTDLEPGKGDDWPKRTPRNTPGSDSSYPKAETDSESACISIYTH